MVIQAVPGKGQISGHPKTNLEIFQSLVRNTAYSFLSESRVAAGDSLTFKIGGGNDSMLIQTAFVQVLQEKGLTIFLSSKTIPLKYSLDVGANRLDVHYDDMYREGFLGSKKIRRTVSTTLMCQLMRTTTQEVIVSRSYSQELSDTVSVDDIADLERGISSYRQGEVPSEDFLDRALEPLIIIGATGIAVFLFFHVRS